MADPIPILRSLHNGNERDLIVLTQPESYRKTLPDAACSSPQSG